nr:MAG TPA: Helix-turn-helix XRE-family like protein [Caudoviricetes sp.]
MRRMRKERIANGWTQEYVAECVGITKSAVCDIESGRRNPSYEVLLKLEDLFGKSHRDLMKII